MRNNFHPVRAERHVMLTMVLFTLLVLLLVLLSARPVGAW